MMSKSVTVIGTIFVDLKGMSFGPVKKDARNIGQVLRSHGGSARNIAENLQMMGLDCIFASTVNDDQLGKEVIDRLSGIGVNTEYILPCPNGMGIWLAVIDNQGNLICSVSHLPNLEKLEYLVRTQIDEIVAKTHGIALDVDITDAIPEMVSFACKSHNIPIYGVVGNLETVKKQPEILAGLDSFVCNKEEAEILLGQQISSREDALIAVRKLAKYGSTRTIITLDCEGCVYYDIVTGEHDHYPSKDVTVIDCTGAGDGFFSGVVYELVQGRGIKQAVTTGTEIALKVIRSADNNLVEKVGNSVKQLA